MNVLSGLGAMVFNARMNKNCPSAHDFKDRNEFKQQECQYIFDYILQYYGIENALDYCCKSADIKRYNVQIEIGNIPYCEFSKNKQCNLFCPYFFYKGCIKED